jgi:tetratricopeptide (TPR) repeat protein
LKRRPNNHRPERRQERSQPPGASLPADSTPVLSTGRQWLFRLLALVLVPLATFAVLEGALRLAGYGYPTAFFEKIRVGDQDLLVNNEEYGLRFFPPELARFSGPIRIAANKPASTYRIFILGESAAMGDPEPSYGASRYLEVLLRERFPEQPFEIVNVAITAINSHAILPIARECARQHGDLWIIYMGNNEMVGPFGAATVFGAQAPPLALVRLGLALQQTRVGQLLMALARKVRGHAATASSWGGMEMFVGNRLRPDEPRKQTVYRNFQRNLHDIVQAGLDSGTRIILNTVAVNLRDCPPFASLSNSNLPAADRALFERFYAEGVAASGQSNAGLAVERFEQAARLDSQYAELQYRWGESLLAGGHWAAAREHWQRACDADALPFRTDSRINGLIREEGRKRAQENLVLLDAATRLGTNAVAGVCGQETFYEHVHLNFAGNYRLGRLWAEEVEESLPAAVRSRAAGAWAAPETCERLLGLTDWNRILVIQSLVRRFYQPPLSSQFNNLQRREALENRVKDLRQQMNPATAEQAREQFHDALKHAPDDHYLHETFAAFLQSIGDLKAATSEWRRVHELLPQDFLSYYQLGRLLSLQGQWTEAETCLAQVVAAHPSMVEAWSELGNVHAGQEKYEQALADYEQARQRRPQDPQVFCGMGKALAKLKRRPEAVERFRQAIRLNPDYWEAHFDLAGELAFDGKIPESNAEFAEAVRLQPANPRAHFNLGVMLAKQNQFDEAQREFEETLRLEPNNQTAVQYLGQVKALKSRKQ